MIDSTIRNVLDSIVEAAGRLRGLGMYDLDLATLHAVDYELWDLIYDLETTGREQS